MTAGAGGRGACVGYTADWAAWRPVDNPGCSIKPYQVFIGADVEHELTFGLDHSMGAGHVRQTRRERRRRKRIPILKKG